MLSYILDFYVLISNSYDSVLYIWPITPVAAWLSELLSSDILAWNVDQGLHVWSDLGQDVVPQ